MTATAPKQEYTSSDHWPRTFSEAYRRGRGPYTAENAWVLLDQEPLELFNGWLVWQAMTNAVERRIAAAIQEILSMVARNIKLGQAYPDQLECKMKSGDVYKPDVCLISYEKYNNSLVTTDKDGEHPVLQGGPELVVEIRSPSNTRIKERGKRRQYFENGTLIVWDVDPRRNRIWVYEATDQTQARLYKESDVIDCPQLLPGWSRPVADFFTKELTAEQIVGEIAVQWREESRDEGRAEGVQQGRAEGIQQGIEQGERDALKKLLLRQARRKFGEAEIPAELEARLNLLTNEQLTELTDTIAVSNTLTEWLGSLPA